MIRLRLAEILKARDWTAYRLAQETGLTVQAAYRLTRSSSTLRRLDIDTLDVLCRVLDVTPGELLEYRAEKRGNR